MNDQVAAGWFLRGLHHNGSSAMVIVVVLHLLQVVWAGAYRAPREVNWWTGLAMGGLVLAFALTRLPPALGPEGLLGDPGRDRDHGLAAWR